MDRTWNIRGYGRQNWVLPTQSSMKLFVETQFCSFLFFSCFPCMCICMSECVSFLILSLSLFISLRLRGWILRLFVLARELVHPPNPLQDSVFQHSSSSFSFLNSSTAYDDPVSRSARTEDSPRVVCPRMSSVVVFCFFSFHPIIACGAPRRPPLSGNTGFPCD